MANSKEIRKPDGQEKTRIWQKTVFPGYLRNPEIFRTAKVYFFFFKNEGALLFFRHLFPEISLNFTRQYY